MVTYNLEHLNQPEDQQVSGPIQDDEALLLFAIIKCKRIRTVLEIGGLGGYSARNFLKAIGETGVLYTVDVNPVPVLAPNHIVITKDCREITEADVGLPLDLVFYDCHIFEAQMSMHERLEQFSRITENTLLALHDTNLHPYRTVAWAKETKGGWIHQDVERKMVNSFRLAGYEALMLHTSPDRHDSKLPFRHGLTILSKNTELAV